ncbi:glycosyl hydrolase [Sphingomonas glacialis]|uniref:Glycosyl hydrolase n=1 Tax=Sphingomonas glacialis TaxID=658225 RepID=A0ABQ3LAR2_9SPHN|nr:glycoside hydrolase family 3 C-terminal domain-containing protein [Sphingomonas glacialis]GHH09913.1 glycosyl hydrolase [Sphingomonas glacialis]
MTLRIAAVPLLLVGAAASAQVAAPPPPAKVAPVAGTPVLPAWNKPAIRGAWNDTRLTPDLRAKALVAAMTRDEKLTLVFGYFGTDFPVSLYHAPVEAHAGSAGYVPAIARLGIPAQHQTDAGVGVATQGGAAVKRERTALPSNVAIAASWDVAVAHAGGAMIGDEAHRSGFNVMLAGGVDLLREPRNGRNFEYGGEDPLLAGTMVAEQVRGIQSNHVISTIKHYAFNDQETDRNTGNSVIEHGAARVSDLLAFQLAIERADPGSIMCSYNRVDGTHACENSWLLTDVLRTDWGFKGYVMSDWGATHSTAIAANAGLDQDSGFPFDTQPFFAAPLREAVERGEVTPARLDLMTTRIVRSMFGHGVFEDPAIERPIDYAAHVAVTRAAAEAGAVLLKNQDDLLPLAASAKRIAVIGGHADKGVLAGGGSSLVYPIGGNAVPGLLPTGWPGPIMYHPSSPLDEIKRHAPGATVTFADGSDPVAAAALARDADIVIVFATQWQGESFDTPMTLDGTQDALIDAVGAANSKTVVVLETGSQVAMPWLDHVGAVLEAWYPGTQGGAAIANLLFGKVNPSGRLPMTFAKSVDQLADPATPHVGNVAYSEGATVGYKWFDAKAIAPLFAFGHGLSYTRFTVGGLTAVAANGALTARFTVRNTGARAGASVPQIYVSPDAGGWEAPKRLGGFAKVALAPGASQTVSMSVDRRLLATWDEAGHQWKVAGGAYKVMLADSARDIRQTVTVTLPAQTMPATWRAK